MATEGAQIAIRPRESEVVVKTVGLISDTHIPVRARRIPHGVFKAFEEVDFIVHAGDLVEMSVIDELEQLAPVLAVYGNMDGPKIRSRLPKQNSANILDRRIGVMHNPGALFGRKKMLKIAEVNDFNVLVYGHTHSPSIRWERDTLFINPGSPTNPLPPFITRPSVALLKITADGVMPKIIQI